MRRDLMLKFKETQKIEDFEAVIKEEEMNRFITSTCRKKLGHCPTSLYDINDLINIAYVQVWRSINDYKFICPVCGLRAFTEKHFLDHVKNRHNTILRPKKEIEQHVIYNVGAYIQNAIRGEYADIRKSNIGTINIFSSFFNDGTNSEEEIENSKAEGYFLGLERCSSINENEIIFKILMSTVMEKFDLMSRKIFNMYIFDNMRQTDIAEILLREGAYSSKQSAAMMVSRKLKEIFRSLTSIYTENAENFL